MLKNKKIIFFLIVFCLLFLSSNVFAFTFNYNEETYNLPDLPPQITKDSHYIITYHRNGYFCLYYTNDTDFDKFINYGTVYNILNKSGSFCNRYLIELNTDASSWGNLRSWGDLSTVSQNTIYYATDNVYNTDGTIFFQKTPLQQTLQVVEITQVEEIPKAIVQVLKTIIPVGLVVLSIFLVIYLIRLATLRQL